MSRQRAQKNMPYKYLFVPPHSGLRGQIAVEHLRQIRVHRRAGRHGTPSQTAGSAKASRAAHYE